MQKDYHFYGIYFLLRSSGIEEDRSRRIAFASQFTDDAKDGQTIRTGDGHEFNAVHTSFSFLTTPFARRAQFHVWLPFHFLPGLKGNSPEEMLYVRPFPLITRSIMSQLLEGKVDDYQVGIYLHSWADTWAHSGFSARSGPENNVKSISTINEEKDRDKILADYAVDILGGSDHSTVLSVGHCEAGICPDEPYLNWGYVNGLNQTIPRNNPDIFLKASKNIYNFINNLDDSTSKGWDEIKSDVADVLNMVGDLNARSRGWFDLITSGNCFSVTEGDKNIEYDEYEWKSEVLKDEIIIVSTSDLIQSDWYKFHSAARWFKEAVFSALPPTIENMFT